VLDLSERLRTGPCILKSTRPYSDTRLPLRNPHGPGDSLEEAAMQIGKTGKAFEILATGMLKFVGGTIGIISLIGLLVGHRPAALIF
jgi:hypothetical protein